MNIGEHITHSEYGPFAQELVKKAMILRQPVNGTFELTYRCNLNCNMCSVRYPLADTIQKKLEITAKEWLEIAFQAQKKGMIFLLLTGGEVFLRSDFFEILCPLTKMGLIITVFTNGTLIDEKVANKLSECPPNYLEITLYGSSAATYESVTGVLGSYDKCMKGIKALMEHKIPFGLKATLTKKNIHDLAAMKNMAKSLGLPFSSSWLLSKRKGGLKNIDDCRVEMDAGIGTELMDYNNASKGGEENSVDKPSIFNSRKLMQDSENYKKDNFYCQAGTAAFSITPQGEMNVCLDLPKPSVSPLKIGFSSAWIKLQDYVDASPPLDPLCINCDLLNYCERCPAWSEMETGYLNQHVPYLCDMAKLRKQKYDIYNR